jgi:hypothetical protein
VKALKVSRLIILEHEAFKSIITKDPGVGVKMLWALASELGRRLTGNPF